MSQVTLAGKLMRNGVALAFCDITLSLIDDSAVVTATTTGNGDYSLAVLPGTWRVTLHPQNEIPQNIGLIEVNNSTSSQSLDTLLRHLTPDTIDAGTLSFFYGLVDRAERVSGGMDDLLAKAKGSADTAGEWAEKAGEALKAAQEIAKTPGPSAYDVWKAQQPADADTSMTAYLAFQEGKLPPLSQFGEVRSYVWGKVMTQSLYANHYNVHDMANALIPGNCIAPVYINFHLGVPSLGTRGGGLSGTWRIMSAMYFYQDNPITLLRRII
ncbi:carboxypeptidase regulatory-like domain-containing protein [Salmonella enterica]|nr:carboxypeptidase regulatory-like domain-containing protein [Salmonella enterica]EJD8366772.1 carboxypeptidase regulatory-like domain-containing protein [Salmonella enterica]EJF3763531.1 carboxypeptidase regulatory-like domain-containing protein [Salmonella enterica]EJF3899506.1 carboxypeptidase regulatory-like domain-containing protein [Salmonella enterica]